MSRFNNLDMFLIVIFIIPIIFGFIRKFNSYESKQDIYGFEKNLILLLSGIVCLFWADRGIVISKFMEFAKGNQYVLSFANGFPRLYFFTCFFTILTLMYYLMKILIYVFNSIILFPILDGVYNFSKERGFFFGSVLGAVFSIPKSIIYLVIVCFIISFVPISEGNVLTDNSIIYKDIQKKAIDPIKSSSIISSLPRILNNSLNIRVIRPDDKEDTANGSVNKYDSHNVIIYYNGVTLEEGIKSSVAIDNKAAEITSGKRTSRAKALSIYKWIGSNISYDNDKAERVLRGETSKDSGAILCFNERKGICFDYACLFVAMCRSQNMRVRIITGRGYNGYEWVSHAWNQVYLDETKGWVNVDPTFAVAGDYFDNSGFYRDHKQEQIAGEW